jgi:uncharacterized protein (DUF2461 family)
MYLEKVYIVFIKMFVLVKINLHKPRFAVGLQRATALKRGGYYLNIQPGNNFIACGFFSPNSDDLKRIRKDIELNHSDWRKF